MKSINMDLGVYSYDITIGNNILSDIKQLYPQIENYKKIHIITDLTVKELYLDKLIKILNYPYISYTVIKEGEQYKSFETLQIILSDILNNGLDRSSLIIGLGGGIVGDISGFAASVYMRGIDFIQIPTTLLSQVDSSVGGKTAINFENIKNIVGRFYQPKYVLIDISMLETLDEKNIRSGIGEILKYGIIYDNELFKYINTNYKEINDLNNQVIENLIYESINIKREVVEKDEVELGLRMILNFGHTVGHGIEMLKDFDLLHGEAVLLGMLIESYIAFQQKLITKDYYEEIKITIEKFIDKPSINLKQANNIYSKMKYDKKNKEGKIKLVLPIGVGQVKVFQQLNRELIIKCIVDGLK